MTPVPGRHFDGRVSAGRPVGLFLEAGFLVVRENAAERSYPVSEVRVTPGVGSIRRFIRLPDGGMCDVDDAGFLDGVLAAQGGRTGLSPVHRWEKSLACVALALAATVAIAAAGVRWGVPALAERVAFAVPIGAEARMGNETLALLDRFVFAPTGLSGARREELRGTFRDVARHAGIDGKSRLEFRKGKSVGANALALPGGIVVLTDEMAAMARDDRELAAVLAHEAEHVRRRHAVRHLLQNSMTMLVVAAATGDVASVSSLASTVPTLLIDAKYSRDFEREADRAVGAYLKGRKIPLAAYADILERLQAELDRRSPGGGSPLPHNYLSTHPPTGERIAEFRRS